MEDCQAAGRVEGSQPAPWNFWLLGCKELLVTRHFNLLITSRLFRQFQMCTWPPSLAYVTDLIYADILRQFTVGVRKMHQVGEHPEWWVVVSLDGFTCTIQPCKHPRWCSGSILQMEDNDPEGRSCWHITVLESGIPPVCGKEWKKEMEMSFDLICLHKANKGLPSWPMVSDNYKNCN